MSMFDGTSGGKGERNFWRKLGVLQKRMLKL